jgi:hypothetical protein
MVKICTVVFAGVLAIFLHRAAVVAAASCSCSLDLDPCPQGCGECVYHQISCECENGCGWGGCGHDYEEVGRTVCIFPPSFKEKCEITQDSFESCLECKAGYYGMGCEPCDCSSELFCDDGINGKGSCLPPPPPPIPDPLPPLSDRCGNLEVFALSGALEMDGTADDFAYGPNDVACCEDYQCTESTVSAYACSSGSIMYKIQCEGKQEFAFNIVPEGGTGGPSASVSSESIALCTPLGPDFQSTCKQRPADQNIVDLTFAETKVPLEEKCGPLELFSTNKNGGILKGLSGGFAYGPETKSCCADYDCSNALVTASACSDGTLQYNLECTNSGGSYFFSVPIEEESPITLGGGKSAAPTPQAVDEADNLCRQVGETFASVCASRPKGQTSENLIIQDAATTVLEDQELQKELATDDSAGTNSGSYGDSAAVWGITAASVFSALGLLGAGFILTRRRRQKRFKAPSSEKINSTVAIGGGITPQPTGDSLHAENQPIYTTESFSSAVLC